jgi:hypothetical protein
MAGIDSGLPIVASAIGALPGRLAGRPLTWFAPSNATYTQWLETFGKVRAALRSHPADPPGSLRAGSIDFYRTNYLRLPDAREQGQC